MTHPLLHPLQIGTLATWLSVAGFGGVGVAVHGRSPTPTPSRALEETQLITDDFTLGNDSSPETETPEVPSEPQTPAETLPAPPELPELAEIEPLPQIPSFPAVAPKPVETPPQPRPAARSGTTARSSGAPAGRTAAAASRGSGTPGTASSGMSNADRLAAGRMRSPSYPPYSRRNGQTGTVIVEFTVGTDGRVISAYAKQPSPWPLLNAEAVSTVRLWRFPPGGVMKLQRPIVFQIR